MCFYEVVCRFLHFLQIIQKVIRAAAFSVFCRCFVLLFFCFPGRIPRLFFGVFFFFYNCRNLFFFFSFLEFILFLFQAYSFRSAQKITLKRVSLILNEIKLLSFLDPPGVGPGPYPCEGYVMPFYYGPTVT